MMKSRMILKCITWSLLHVFFLHEAAIASPETSLFHLSLSDKASLSFRLPYSIAFVQDSFKARGSDKFVILMQDAHTNESGQMNMARALEMIIEKEHIPYVYVEAGAGDVSLSFLRKSAPLDERRRVAMSFLRKGLLQGSEYLDLTSDLDFKLWGVEDPELYDKGLEIYRDIAADRRRYKRYLTRLENTVKVLRPKIFGDALLAFDDRRERYLGNEIALTDYFEVLSSNAAVLEITLTPFPQIKALKQVKSKEERIDFEKANKEQIRATRTLSAPDQKELLRAGKEDRSPYKFSLQNAGEKKAYYAVLQEKIQNLKPYPELVKYLAYLEDSRKIDPKAVLDEQKHLEDAIYEALAKTPDEKGLLRVARNIRDLAALFDLVASPYDFEKYRREARYFDIAYLTGFLNRKIMDLEEYYDKAVFLEPGFTQTLEKAEEFYQLTYERDLAFLENMFHKMDEEGQSRAILIAGGYHSPNLQELLKKRRVSFVTITPQVLHVTDRGRYERLLLGQLAGGGSFKTAVSQRESESRPVSAGTYMTRQALSKAEVLIAAARVNQTEFWDRTEDPVNASLQLVAQALGTKAIDEVNQRLFSLRQLTPGGRGAGKPSGVRSPALLAVVEQVKSVNSQINDILNTIDPEWTSPDRFKEIERIAKADGLEYIPNIQSGTRAQIISYVFRLRSVVLSVLADLDVAESDRVNSLRTSMSRLEFARDSLRALVDTATDPISPEVSRVIETTHIALRTIDDLIISLVKRLQDEPANDTRGSLTGARPSSENQKAIMDKLSEAENALKNAASHMGVSEITVPDKAIMEGIYSQIAARMDRGRQPQRQQNVDAVLTAIQRIKSIQSGLESELNTQTAGALLGDLDPTTQIVLVLLSGMNRLDRLIDETDQDLFVWDGSELTSGNLNAIRILLARAERFLHDATSLLEGFSRGDSTTGTRRPRGREKLTQTQYTVIGQILVKTRVLTDKLNDTRLFFTGSDGMDASPLETHRRATKEDLKSSRFASDPTVNGHPDEIADALQYAEDTIHYVGEAFTDLLSGAIDDDPAGGLAAVVERERENLNAFIKLVSAIDTAIDLAPLDPNVPKDAAFNRIYVDGREALDELHQLNFSYIMAESLNLLDLISSLAGTRTIPRIINDLVLDLQDQEGLRRLFESNQFVLDPVTLGQVESGYLISFGDPIHEASEIGIVDNVDERNRTLVYARVDTTQDTNEDGLELKRVDLDEGVQSREEIYIYPPVKDAPIDSDFVNTYLNYKRERDSGSRSVETKPRRADFTRLREMYQDLIALFEDTEGGSEVQIYLQDSLGALIERAEGVQNGGIALDETIAGSRGGLRRLIKRLSDSEYPLFPVVFLTESAPDKLELYRRNLDHLRAALTDIQSSRSTNAAARVPRKSAVWLNLIVRGDSKFREPALGALNGILEEGQDLKDVDLSLRQRALESLRPHLSDRVSGEDDVTRLIILQHVIGSLEIHDDAILRTLTENLESPHDQVRISAAQALGRLANAENAEVILASLNGRLPAEIAGHNANVILQLITSMGKLGTQVPDKALQNQIVLVLFRAFINLSRVRTFTSYHYAIENILSRSGIDSAEARDVLGQNGNGFSREETRILTGLIDSAFEPDEVTATTRVHPSYAQDKDGAEDADFVEGGFDRAIKLLQTAMGDTLTDQEHILKGISILRRLDSDAVEQAKDDLLSVLDKVLPVNRSVEGLSRVDPAIPLAIIRVFGKLTRPDADLERRLLEYLVLVDGAEDPVPPPDGLRRALWLAVESVASVDGTRLSGGSERHVKGAATLAVSSAVRQRTRDLAAAFFGAVAVLFGVQIHEAFAQGTQTHIAINGLVGAAGAENADVTTVFSAERDDVERDGLRFVPQADALQAIEPFRVSLDESKKTFNDNESERRRAKHRGLLDQAEAAKQALADERVEVLGLLPEDLSELPPIDFYFDAEDFVMSTPDSNRRDVKVTALADAMRWVHGFATNRGGDVRLVLENPELLTPKAVRSITDANYAVTAARVTKDELRTRLRIRNTSRIDKTNSADLNNGYMDQAKAIPAFTTLLVRGLVAARVTVNHLDPETANVQWGNIAAKDFEAILRAIRQLSDRADANAQSAYLAFSALSRKAFRHFLLPIPKALSNIAVNAFKLARKWLDIAV